MRCPNKEEIELAAGGAVPVGVAIGIGVVTGSLGAKLNGGNAGQIAAGAILGDVADFWGAVGGTIQAINAGVLGLIGMVATGGSGQGGQGGQGGSGQGGSGSGGSSTGSLSSGGQLIIQTPQHGWIWPEFADQDPVGFGAT